MGPTFHALLAAAMLAGFEGATPPSASKKTVDERPKEILRLSLSEIRRDQERAYERHAAGRGVLEFSAGFDPEAELWLKVRQHGVEAARDYATVQKGFELELPVERYKFVLENGFVRAFPVAPPQSPQARASLPALIRGLYNAALQVEFSPIRYAIVHEPGLSDSVPASLCLIREDLQGRFWITHKTLAEMRQIQWFVSINGLMRGMRIEGGELVFFSKPTPVIPDSKPVKAESGPFIL